MACAARVAGDALQLAPADELYSCGLLANCGQLALASVHPQEYGELLGQYGNGVTARLLGEESQRFGHHQLALSANLMRAGAWRTSCATPYSAMPRRPASDGPGA
ncbi:HDOD domain [Janthinobacterium lividum]|nr:HDOD domain [Janthinobacterium lividum]